MLLYWRKGQLEFTTDVEEWMKHQTFTEVFRYSGPPSKEEMEVTGELDTILQEVRYGNQGIKDTLDRMGKSSATLVQGRRATTGEQSVNAAEGTAVDGVFKDRLNHRLNTDLQKWKSVLVPIPQGRSGADVISPSLHAAWDVTTVAEVWDHVQRDVFGKRESRKSRLDEVWDRYYLLVWDEPRTNRMSKVKEIEKGRLVP
jgi:hypothetical protein